MRCWGAAVLERASAGRRPSGEDCGRASARLESVDQRKDPCEGQQGERRERGARADEADESVAAACLIN